ncbi:MAG: hypothetical protein ACYCT2_09075 [Thermoplasmataceae archaeon]
MNPSGNLSRRQYEKMVGKPNVDSAGRKAKSSMLEYNELVRSYIANKKAQGIEVTPRQARQSKELHDFNLALKRKRVDVSLLEGLPNDGDNSPTGMKARALVACGLRDVDFRGDVGQSP